MVARPPLGTQARQTTRAPARPETPCRCAWRLASRTPRALYSLGRTSGGVLLVWNSPRREGTENLGVKTVTQQKPAAARAAPQASPVRSAYEKLGRQDGTQRPRSGAAQKPRSGALRPIGAIRAVYLRPQTAQRIGRSAQSAQSAQSIRARRLCSGLGAQGARWARGGHEGGHCGPRRAAPGSVLFPSKMRGVGKARLVLESKLVFVKRIIFSPILRN
jgi:hypothetical protein